MFPRTLVRLLSVSTLSLIAANAFAGEFSEENGAALNRYDAVSYFAVSPDPIPGVRDLSFDYKDSKFYFITQDHLRAFAADPARYAPQFDGYCAYGASIGNKVAAHPRVFAIVGGKLYMFKDLEARKNWKKDIPGNIARANEQWAAVLAKN